MTQDEITIISKLYACKFAPGTWTKKIVNDMYSSISETLKLSEKQEEWIYRILYKYRKQLPFTYNQYKKNKFCKPVPKIKIN